MRQTLLTIMLLLFAYSAAYSQDLLYTTDGEILQVKILKVTDVNVKFEKKAVPGVAYTYEKSKVQKIVYENGTTDVFTAKKDPREISKPEEKVKTIKEINAEKMAERKHAFYAGTMGAGGLFSTNYELNVYRGKWVHPYIRLGFGLSNKSILVPHSVTVGIGSAQHQFDVGFGGSLYINLQEKNDPNEEWLKFVYGKAETKYLFYPIFGYRFVDMKGFYATVSMKPIVAKDDYNPLDGSTNETWGITPWFEFGIGFTF